MTICTSCNKAFTGLLTTALCEECRPLVEDRICPECGKPDPPCPACGEVYCPSAHPCIAKLAADLEEAVKTQIFKQPEECGCCPVVTANETLISDRGRYRREIADLQAQLTAIEKGVLDDVHDIVAEYLKRYGYDGLFNSDADCACELDELAPCGEPSFSCHPGFKYGCDCGDHDFHIGTAAVRDHYIARHGSQVEE